MEFRVTSALDVLAGEMSLVITGCILLNVCLDGEVQFSARNILLKLRTDMHRTCLFFYFFCKVRVINRLWRLEFHLDYENTLIHAN